MLQLVEDKRYLDQFAHSWLPSLLAATEPLKLQGEAPGRQRARKPPEGQDFGSRLEGAAGSSWEVLRPLGGLVLMVFLFVGKLPPLSGLSGLMVPRFASREGLKGAREAKLKNSKRGMQRSAPLGGGPLGSLNLRIRV